MKLPIKKIKIGSHKWDVKKADLSLPSHSRISKEFKKYGMSDLFFGQVTWEDTCIRLNKDINQEALGEVLLHEILHVIMDEINLHKYLRRDIKVSRPEQEEDVVQALACYILMVLRDNPRLIDFLLNKNDK